MPKSEMTLDFLSLNGSSSAATALAHRGARTAAAPSPDAAVAGKSD